MKKNSSIEGGLERMIELLRGGSADDWALSLENIKVAFEMDPKSSSLKLLSLYGGMGSLNDVVLYKDGQPLVVENDELDTLRLELYNLCKSIA